MPLELDIQPSDVDFLETLQQCKNSVVFKVSIHGKLRVMKVYHDRGISEWDPVDYEVNLFLRESTAYQRLKQKGFCTRGVVPDFYGTLTNIQPTSWPNLYMFVDDKLPPNAIFIEYIPGMSKLDLSNYSPSNVNRLRDILFEMHQTKMLHGDSMPRNMMICSGQENRVLWLDFDSAQTFPEDEALTTRQERWVAEEVELMDYFVDGLAQDNDEGRLNCTYSYYYDWFV
ncbi:hypothetical protein BO94DRAFT_567321 [Aspergillus sclerotioniger CBS 115572]|uniref:Protein kinase domain-containing protein n=1 Tax=Aspergillus sclerotioniger CBS 115572 TaxID=1450535 RepID=A0A317W7Q5_9EURO|nr:hypothetical protein BO94DRAFT_567321 [Aspergillus sclerotioniger CBS 115572]PWY81701.1 hypothetical protein BO94DRAFT_567321 [Aspergillus sclerotioniger CBS 115572]